MVVLTSGQTNAVPTEISSAATTKTGLSLQDQFVVGKIEIKYLPQRL